MDQSISLLTLSNTENVITRAGKDLAVLSIAEWIIGSSSARNSEKGE